MRPSMTDSSVLCLSHRAFQTGIDKETKSPIEGILDNKYKKGRFRMLKVMSDVLKARV
jgi:hypothetical protein